MEFHEIPSQRTCWVQIGLQEPHWARPSWLVLHSHLGGRQFPMEGRQKSRSNPIGYYGRSQKSGKNESTKWVRGESSRAMICEPVSLGARHMSIRSLVPKAGLEPARLAPHAPQTCVSAISPLRRMKSLLQRRGKRIIEVGQNPCQSIDGPVESGG